MCKAATCSRQPLDLWPGGYCRECYEKRESRLARRRLGGDPVGNRESQIPQRRFEGREARDIERRSGDE